MKSRFLSLFLVALVCLMPTSSAWALDEGSPEAIVTDVLIVRPACLVVTVFGSVFFVVALPFAATSGTVGKVGESLVTKPARATFIRPVGEFATMR